MGWVTKLLRRTRGVTTVEYALLVMLAGVAGFFAMDQLGRESEAMMDRTAAELCRANGGVPQNGADGSTICDTRQTDVAELTPAPSPSATPTPEPGEIRLSLTVDRDTIPEFGDHDGNSNTPDQQGVAIVTVTATVTGGGEWPAGEEVIAMLTFSDPVDTSGANGANAWDFNFPARPSSTNGVSAQDSGARFTSPGSYTFVVTAINDSDFDDDEVMTIDLTNDWGSAFPAAMVVGSARVTVTIDDDEVSFCEMSAAELEGLNVDASATRAQGQWRGSVCPNGEVLVDVIDYGGAIGRQKLFAERCAEGMSVSGGSCSGTPTLVPYNNGGLSNYIRYASFSDAFQGADYLDGAELTELLRANSPDHVAATPNSNGVIPEFIGGTEARIYTFDSSVVAMSGERFEAAAQCGGANQHLPSVGEMERIFDLVNAEGVDFTAGAVAVRGLAAGAQMGTCARESFNRSTDFNVTPLGNRLIFNSTAQIYSLGSTQAQVIGARQSCAVWTSNQTQFELAEDPDFGGPLETGIQNRGSAVGFMMQDAEPPLCEIFQGNSGGDVGACASDGLVLPAGIIWAEAMHAELAVRCVRRAP